MWGYPGAWALGAELFHADRQTDGQTEITKLIVAFRNFSDASKNLVRKGAENILKYKDLTIEIQLHVDYRNKYDTSNHRGNWKHLRIIQKTYQESMKSRKSRKQSYWAWHSYFGK